jgi:two-component system chemotaxis response regulator CheB
MRLKFVDSRYLVSVEEDNNAMIFKPSVDVLFESVAKLPISSHTRAALLTGMGSDGALGMAKLKDEGAYTLAQDENTSVIFGMPKKAIEMGATDDVAPLGEIALKLLF